MASNPYDVFGAPLKIRHKGVYDMKALLAFVYQWYMDNQYIYHEKRYKDKTETALGNEIEIETYGERKVNEYFKYFIEINTHQWESRDIKIKVDGKEMTVVQGRIEVQINGKVITDWQGRFKTPFWITMQKWMEKVILKKEIEFKHIDPIDKQLHDLAQEIKNYLKIESSS
ncbi:hypothetical protein JW711_04960 [Candidatus Woesearchaeota archaeon]|nr:hypothetical protein [Candidatus Woesearchaeota archaeon]